MILEWVVVICVFQGICPFHLIHPIYRHEVHIIHSFIILLVSVGICSYISSLFQVVSFFFGPTRGLSLLFTYPKNKILVLLILTIAFTFSVALISAWSLFSFSAHLGFNFVFSLILLFCFYFHFIQNTL